jgi:aspartate carbamoyltransferase regulatory subunit
MSQKEKLVVEAILNGTVIDHIPAERTLQLVSLLTSKDDCYFLGVNLQSTSVGKKGIVKIQDKILEERELQILAALAPNATVNVIENYRIIEKKVLTVPKDVINLFICPNSRCVSNHENVGTRFVLGASEHRCGYCERSFPVSRLTSRQN